jgi:hypothetical protein
LGRHVIELDQIDKAGFPGKPLFGEAKPNLH